MSKDKWSPVVMDNIKKVEEREKLELKPLLIGTIIIVKTANSEYELTKKDILKDVYQIKGGIRYPQAKEVVINGCTFGGSAIMVDRLCVGMHMEIFDTERQKTITTSGIEKIQVRGKDNDKK
jgi:hypothetical protein